MLLIPESKVVLILDENSSMVKPDVFCYPVHRNLCSFPELCREIVDGTIKWHGDQLIIYFGHGQVFRLTANLIKHHFQQLVETIWQKDRDVHIFISTLPPPPTNARVNYAAYMKFNTALESVVVEWMQQQKAVTLLPSHLCFVKPQHILDEKTGLLVDTYVEVEPGVHFQGNRLNIVGWFKLRNFWLQELRMLPTVSYVTRDWREVQLEIIRQRQQEVALQFPTQEWPSPTSVICLGYEYG